MELKWIEDFLSLADTLNFSRSAAARNVTQPAFGRRIRALENWLGADLLDRSCFPCTLTTAGELFVPIARSMLTQSQEARLVLRGQLVEANTLVRFSMPHTLLLTFFPRFLSELEEKVGGMASKVVATNVHDAVMALVEQNADLLICYHHARQSLDLDAQRYPWFSLGIEPLRPYVKPDARGLPLFALPGSPDKPLPLLAYSPYTSLGRIVERMLADSPRNAYLFRRFESDLAEGLKQMAVQGHGIAWLPASAVAREVAEKQLVLAVSPNEPDAIANQLWCEKMEIRIYKSSESTLPVLNRIWAYLQQEADNLQ